MPLPHDVHALLHGLPWTVLDTFDTPFGTFRRNRIAITEPHDDDVWLAWRAHKAALKPLGYRVWLDEENDTWFLDHDDDPRRGATPDPKLDQAFLDELPWGESERVHHREFGDTHRATAVLDARSEIVFWPLWNARKDALLRSGYAVVRQGRRGAWYLQRHIALSEEDRDRDRERARLSRAHDADVTLTSPDGLDYLPYQRAGILYALDRPRTLLADAPGLGKTIQALGAIGNDPDGGLPALVIVPASLKLNWTRETQAWLPDAYPIRLNGRLPPALRTTFLAALDQLGLDPGAPAPGPAAVREALGDAEAALFAGEAVTWRKHVRLPGTPIRQVEASHLLGALFHPRALILLNYDIATSWEPLLARLPGLSTLVLDEIHYCKNGKAKRTKAVRRLAKRFARAIGMTGTPIVNRPAELLPQLDILGVTEELFGTGWNFLQRYTNAQRTQFGWDFTGASNLDELQERLRSRVMVRRRKEDVLTELPAKRRQIVELEIGDSKVQRLIDHERDTYRKHEEEVTRHRAAVAAARERGEDASYRAAVERLREAEGLAFSEIAAARYEVAMSKVPSVTEYLATALESGEKIVCFAHHKDVVTALEEAFAGRSVTISGKTAPDRRQAAVDRFQNDASIRLFIGNIAAAGVGLTLTASSHVVFAELDWTPAAMTQAEDRCVLEGQPVLTVEGWKPIETIEVGDRVIAHDGQPHRVTDAWNRLARSSHAHNSKDISEISVRGWLDPIKVTSDHRILTDRGWIEAGALTPRDKIHMPAATPGGELTRVPVEDDCRLPATFTAGGYAIFGNHDEVTRTKPSSLQANGRLAPLPEAIDLTPDAMFTFGYYMGDGFAAIGADKGRFVSLAGHYTQKATHLERCKAWFETLGTTASIYPASKGKGIELRAFQGEAAKWFAKHFGRTLEDKRVPEWVHSTSQPLRQAFIDGWLAAVDTADGYQRFFKTGGERKEIITGRYRLAADAVRLLLGLGEKPCLTRNDHGNFYSVAWVEGTAPKLVVTQVVHRTCNRTERVYDLTVEDASTFVVGTSVVHNCHRYGQQDRVLITHLVWDGSLDATMARTLVEKQRVAEQAMDNLPTDDSTATPQPTTATPAPLDGQVGETGAAPLFEPEGAGEGSGEGPSLAQLRRRHGRDPRSDEERQHEHRRGLVQGRAARIRSHSPALPRFDARQAAALHASMQHLAAEDPDRARTRNAAGFSKADGPVGHHLAQEATLGSDELLVAYNLALTYQGQLPAQLLLAAGILDLEAELAERHSKENPA